MVVYSNALSIRVPNQVGDDCPAEIAEGGTALHFLCFYDHPTLSSWFTSEWSDWGGATYTESRGVAGSESGDERGCPTPCFECIHFVIRKPERTVQQILAAMDKMTRDELRVVKLDVDSRLTDDDDDPALLASLREAIAYAAMDFRVEKSRART